MKPPTDPARRKTSARPGAWRSRFGGLLALQTALVRALADDNGRRSPPHE